MLKEFYDNPCPCGAARNNKSTLMVVIILSSWDLDAQQKLFKFTMKSNVFQAMAKMVALAVDKVQPQIVNPLSHLWKVINVCQFMSHIFSTYLKLVKIVMIHVFLYVKDERCVNFVSYFESKLWKHLIMHLSLVVVMYAQCFFTFDTFPYATRFESWTNVTTTYGRG
jgi:hypothetical protein